MVSARQIAGFLLLLIVTAANAPADMGGLPAYPVLVMGKSVSDDGSPAADADYTITLKLPDGMAIDSSTGKVSSEGKYAKTFTVPNSIQFKDMTIEVSITKGNQKGTARYTVKGSEAGNVVDLGTLTLKPPLGAATTVEQTQTTQKITPITKPPEETGTNWPTIVIGAAIIVIIVLVIFRARR